ncbi:MAG: hypothetical protein PHO28_02865 [Candidatus Pacebacteria bacterium]|nr:hypothetical protein [Candidatus Paceibacterota bacterium]
MVKAQTQLPPNVTPPANAGLVLATVQTITDWIFWGILMAAAIVILVSAIMFLTAGGNADKTKTARDYLMYAVIAVVIAFLARAVVYFIFRILGGSGDPFGTPTI